MNEFGAVDTLVQAQECVKLGQVVHTAGFMTGHGSAGVALALEPVYQSSWNFAQ